MSPSLRLRIGEADACLIGPAGEYDSLVHQQMIAHADGGVHGRRRHNESLHQRGGAEQQNQDVDGPLGDEITRRVSKFAHESYWTG